MINNPKVIFYSLLLLTPSLIAVLTWIFTKPVEEEARIGKLRKSLLEFLRFKFSFEISHLLPIKNNKFDEIFLAKVRDILQEYYSSNSQILYDFINSENIFNSYISTLRAFKYSIISSIVLAVILTIILYLISSNDTYYIILTLILSLTLFIFWFRMERKKDKYHDICMKYEITDETKTK